MTHYSRRYRRVARRLSLAELRADSMDAAFGIEDLVADLEGTGHRRFLDFYGDEGIRTGLERYGLTSALERRGGGHIEIFTRADDDRHTLILSGTDEGSEPAHPDGRRDHLVELVVRRDRLVPEPGPLYDEVGGELSMLTVDWLTLRNPAASFTVERPQLPGQDAPGLGLGERVLELLYRVVDRLEVDMLGTVGEFFHNAVLYRRELPFFDPRYAAQYETLVECLMQDQALSLAQASWAIEWGLLRCVSGDNASGDNASGDNASGQPFAWRGELQVRARDTERGRAVARHLGRRAHRRAIERARGDFAFELQRREFDERWAVERGALEGRDSPPV